jgi:putative endonuclease
VRWAFWRRPETADPRHRTGRLGERAAARHLRRRGHRVLARNVRCRRGEVDLITLERRTRTVCFVEVRTRATREGEDPFVAPEATVTPAKRRRIVAAAREYLAGHGGFDRPIRFDVVSVRFEGDGRRRPVVRHFPAAFDANGR